MILLVSRNKSLFKSTKYKEASFEEAMKILLPLSLVQFDTETMGLDCWTKELLTVQLGCTDNQVVFDWTTLSSEEKLSLKEYFESDRTFIGHNLMFDLTFMYVQGIWVKHIYDTMIAEQLIYLGYPKRLSKELYDELAIDFSMYDLIPPKDPKSLPRYELSYSLKSTAKRRINVDIDKTVRGKIINEGLTEQVVEYAAGDVMWLEKIRDSQIEELKKQDLIKACEFECEAVKGIAYIKYCGVHLSIEKWRDKMERDEANLLVAEKALNDWVVNWDKNRTKDGEWDIRYPELEVKKDSEIPELVKELLKNKYIRSPQEDLSVPYKSEKVQAYKKRVTSLFTKVDTQGDLFNGFSTEPQCIINWSSAPQVIRLFELLGINVETFDKETNQKKKSVEEDILKPQEDKFPIIKPFLQYKKAKKLTSTYGQNWINAINKRTGRIHVEISPIGTDTCRLSSGGGPYKLNQQNLPKDSVTRGCFTAEKGNVWVSIDYSGQESCIIASVSKDSAMVDLLNNKGDIHSLVAYMSYPNIIPRDTKIEEIKKKYHSQRQDAKGIEFSINYGGDANTIVANKGIPLKEAQEIYDNFMKGFPGVKTYQDYCRKKVMQDGYIIMNNIFRHRAHIYDAEWLFRMQNKFKEEGFWEYYREMKRDSPSCGTVKSVKRYFTRKSDSEKHSINYKIQNRGACCFKLSLILFFNWIIDNNYQNIVKICIAAHDEFNVECPKDLSELVTTTLKECMIKGGKPFCPNVYLDADVSYDEDGNLPTYWIHE